MGFYSDWLAAAGSPRHSISCRQSFLQRTEESTVPLVEGPQQELQAAYEVLQTAPLSTFLDELSRFEEPPELQPADVPMYSRLEHGICRVSEILEFSPEGLTYEELGYMLIQPVRPLAKYKYGECHGKLAAMLRLATLTSKPVRVCPTAFGSFLTRFELDEKRETLKKLMLRTRIVQALLVRAIDGPVSYPDLIPFFTPVTMARRRPNVKAMTDFVLSDTVYAPILQNISWEIPR